MVTSVAMVISVAMVTELILKLVWYPTRLDNNGYILHWYRDSFERNVFCSFFLVPVGDAVLRAAVPVRCLSSAPSHSRSIVHPRERTSDEETELLTHT